jgi:hypothetical protein
LTRRCVLVAALWLLACPGGELPEGRIEGAGRPAEAIEARTARQQETWPAPEGDGAHAPQILFGDLHVHTTYSLDAFLYALPLFGGEGAHPPADACDFARYCAEVDFFAITDHAESLTPERWTRIQESLRACQARAGDPGAPDLVAFAGFEWTQVGATPEEHYGHKNVIFPQLEEEALPARPITSLDEAVLAGRPHPWLLRAPRAFGLFGLRPYADLLWLVEQLAELPNCPEGVDTRALPKGCRENAPTPERLFEKLDQWGGDALVIPHGLAWGLHVPQGARLDNQLRPGRHDAQRQVLLEVYSGHGNSEEYRSFPESEIGPGDEAHCPEPTPDFLPCCWRAGEIMRERCDGLSEATCQERVDEARRLAARARTAPHRVFPDTRPEDWLDCDQCRDCFKPVYSLRPGASAQYALAISNLGARDEDGAPLRFRMGLIASSDDHRAQPGTGYKQVQRKLVTDARGAPSKRSARVLDLLARERGADPSQPQPGGREQRSLGALLDVERVASFMYPGGLTAVHALGRSREAIWQALARREAYGTSGPRILLSFDLVNGPKGRAPMGSHVAMGETPRFRVRAVGALVQLPGCPTESANGLSPERLRALCHGECHHPGDARHRIEAIEVVRIRPQVHPDEDVGDLIEDPWLRHVCPADPGGCRFDFEDPDHAASGRDAVYYVRALQEPTPAINADTLRVERDAEGRALAVRPCHGGFRTAADDDCLAPARERAWSSPIFVDQR